MSLINDIVYYLEWKNLVFLENIENNFCLIVYFRLSISLMYCWVMWKWFLEKVGKIMWKVNSWKMMGRVLGWSLIFRNCLKIGKEGWEKFFNGLGLMGFVVNLI